jgi:hypothetical protein
MPLYPDELISMIKHAALQNVHNIYKLKVPPNKDAAEVDNVESDLNDMEYIEHYSDKNFDELAKMAQAYSDYGVLNDKKGAAKTEKSPVVGAKVSDKKMKLKGKSLKHSLFDRFKKG